MDVLCMDVLCKWMCNVSGCLCKWMCLCKGGGREAGGGRRRRGCIQNENPHIGELVKIGYWGAFGLQIRILYENLYRIIGSDHVK